MNFNNKNKFQLAKTIGLYSLMFLLCLEIMLRGLGYTVFEQFPIQLRNIEPSSSMKHDPYLGFSLKEGEFVYNYIKRYSFKATHNKDGARYSGESMASKDNYGCSLFYGFGLDDSLVFTYRLQDEMPDYRINNYAIFAHNMVSSYLQLKRHIEEGMNPKVAVISYSSWNLSRNVYSILFRENLTTNRHIDTSKNLEYCFARLNNKNSSKLEFGLEKFDYKPFWLSNYSALSNRIQKIYINYENSSYYPEQVETILINQIIELCDRNKVKLVFALVTRDSHTNEIKELLESKNVNIVDLGSIDINNEKFNLMPYDNHPNSLAHKYYTSKLLIYLKNNAKY